MLFPEFLAKQEKIYSEFRDTSKIEAEGLMPQISENKGGYIIALRHPKNIVTGIEEINEKISRVTPSIIYDKNNIHTTLATYQELDGFFPVKDQLKNLANIVSHNASLIKNVEIEYSEWLINQNSGIAGGVPNMAFFEIVKKIIENAHKNGFNLKFPWGAHITISRFLEKISYDQTLELLRIFKNRKPLGISRPKYIDLGHYILTQKSFKINVYERFEL